MLSKVCALPRGGPQGRTLGIEEYLSQTNGNTDFLEDDEKYKFIDDLSILEILNLISMALSNYDYQSHVASDIGTEHKYVDPNSLKTQTYLDKIADWTDKKEMKLNCKKTKYMIFNPSKNFQFNTRLKLEGKNIEQVHETKLLGVIIQDDLSFKSNTEFITKKAYKRMIILKNLYHFNLPISDMIEIYCLYIRSVVEQAAVVWHSSLTKGEQLDIERIQKVAMRIMLQENYVSYSHALKITGMPTLKSRRNKLCLTFAKNCVKTNLTNDMFPINSNNVNTRQHEKFYVPHAKTDRFAKSAIPYMARLLNANV